MYLDPKSTIAGMPALSIRQLLNKHDIISLSLIVERFNISERIAGIVLTGLLDEGYVELNECYSKHGEVCYHPTLKGCSLALASAAKPVTRKTAEKKIEEFLQRVEEVNKNEYYLYRVDKVVVFGSYLSDQERINDIDVVAVLKRKGDDLDKFRAETMKRANDAEANGRKFSGANSKRYYTYEEVNLFLKSRSRTISLHSRLDYILKLVDWKTIYPVGGQEDVQRMDIMQRRILYETCYTATVNDRKDDDMMVIARNAIAAAGFEWTNKHEQFVLNWHESEL